jgi:hypothetical protein
MSPRPPPVYGSLYLPVFSAAHVARFSAATWNHGNDAAVPPLFRSGVPRVELGLDMAAIRCRSVEGAGERALARRNVDCTGGGNPQRSPP